MHYYIIRYASTKENQYSCSTRMQILIKGGEEEEEEGGGEPEASIRRGRKDNKRLNPT